MSLNSYVKITTLGLLVVFVILLGTFIVPFMVWKVLTYGVPFVILSMLIIYLFGDNKMFSFLKNFGKVKVKQMGTETRKLAARLDSEGFNEAVLGEMEDRLTQFGIDLAEARQRANKERNEAKEVQALYNQRLSAAEAIKAQVDGGDTSKEPSLLRMLDLLESTKDAVQKENQEADFWEDNLSIIQDRYDKAAAEMKGAKTKISQATAKMEQAEMKEEQAKMLEEQRKRASGLSSTMGSLDVALSALDDATTKAEARAEAANISLETFKSSNIEEEDEVIKAAMAAASGKGSSASVDDRLAALR